MTNKTTKTLMGLVALLAICLVLTFTLNGNTVQEETVKIGYIGPLTGDAGILGLEASMAIELAVKEANLQGGINGKMIELFIEDDQYNTQKTLDSYNKLVNINEVDTLLVSTYGGLFAIADQAKRDNVLVVDVLDCEKPIADLPDNVFCVAKETEDLGTSIADFAAQKGHKEVGILHNTVDEFMPSVALAFKDRFESSDRKVNIQSFTPDTRDFRAHLLKMKDSDSIVFLGYDEVGIAMKQTRDLGIEADFLTIPTVATSPSIVEASQGTIEGIHFSFYAPDKGNPVAESFQDRFEDEHGRAPIVLVATDQAYDATKILTEEVLPEVKAKNREKQLEQKIDAFHKVKGFEGVTGNLRMSSDGRIQGIKIKIFKLKDLVPEFVQ